jgi:NAD(P)-dependent dehydrogenase (short-subunit alcohol dehydrogenase family)
VSGPRFAGRVALVTGASSGVGRATAVALAAAGARVGLTGRDPVALTATADAIGRAGAETFTVAGDVRRDGDVAAMVEQVEARFGGIDLVVHAAGVFRIGALTELAEEDWDVVIDTNLKGCFLLARHAIPALRRRGGGAVVHVSSVTAQAADPGEAAYAASKAGVDALTRTMALDHAAECIRVNAVAPGTIRTRLITSYAEEHYPEDPDSMLAAAAGRHPIGRLIEPEDVAELVLFLLSDAAAAITGATYTIDGGWLGQLGGA